MAEQIRGIDAVKAGREFLEKIETIVTKHDGATPEAERDLETLLSHTVESESADLVITHLMALCEYARNTAAMLAMYALRQQVQLVRAQVNAKSGAPLH